MEVGIGSRSLTKGKCDCLKFRSLLMVSTSDAAGTWFNVLRRDVHSSLGQHSDLVRVAIIDTGAVFDKKTMMIYGSRVKEVRSWVGLHGNKDGLWRPDGEDTDGHGTHATSVFLEVDPYSEVYVAKVFDSRDEKQGIAMQTKVQTRIANVSSKVMWTEQELIL